MVETSDDRNGVVVNGARRGVHAIDSTRAMANCLVEERCSEKASAKSSSEIHAKSEGVLYSASTELEQKINFYGGSERRRASLSDGS